jgi:hypothetical protein
VIVENIVTGANICMHPLRYINIELNDQYKNLIYFNKFILKTLKPVLFRARNGALKCAHFDWQR